MDSEKLAKIEEIMTEVDSNWTCDESLVTLRPSPKYECQKGWFNGDENQILWTGHYYLLLNLLGIKSNSLIFYNEWRNKVYRISELQVEPGLFNRHVNFRKDGSSWDEYVGLTLISYLFGPLTYLSQDIVDYGRKHFSVYNNVDMNDPDRNRKYQNEFLDRLAWILAQWRQPKEIGWYRFVAKKRIGIFNSINMIISFLITIFDSSKDSQGNVATSGLLMAWRKLVIMRDYGFVWKKLYELLMKRLNKYYGDKPLTKMHDIYWHEGETQEYHPFRKLIRLYE